MSRRLSAAILAALTLAGCAADQAKPGGPAAKLRIAIYSQFAASLYAQDLNACPEGRRLMHQQVATFQSGQDMAPAFAEMQIAADRDAKVALQNESVRVVGPQIVCSLGIGFPARGGAQYEIEFRHTGDRCSATVYEVAGSGRRTQVADARQFKVDKATNLCSL